MCYKLKKDLCDLLFFYVQTDCISPYRISTNFFDDKPTQVTPIKKESAGENEDNSLNN